MLKIRCAAYFFPQPGCGLFFAPDLTPVWLCTDSDKNNPGNEDI
jgi:hypothetical protein